MVEEKPTVEPEGKPKPDGSVVEEQEKLDKEQLDNAEKPQDKIDRAHEENDRTERLLKKKEELIEREEKLKVNEILGGDSLLSEKVPKEDAEKAAAKALLPEGMDCPGVTD